MYSYFSRKFVEARGVVVVVVVALDDMERDEMRP